MANKASKSEKFTTADVARALAIITEGGSRIPPGPRAVAVTILARAEEATHPNIKEVTDNVLRSIRDMGVEVPEQFRPLFEGL